MNQTKVQSVHCVADQDVLKKMAGGYVVGRFYKTAKDPNVIWYAVSTDQLETIVSGTTFSNFETLVANAFQEIRDTMGTKLGKTEQAVDSAKFAGKTYAAVRTEWATDIAAREAVIMAAIAGDVKHIFTINFQDGDTVDTTKLDTSAGVIFANLPNGKYMFVLNGPAKASVNVTNYFGKDAPAIHSGSNNDYYLTTIAGGVVTSIVRRNDTTNELLAAYQAALTELENRIQTVEGISGANGMTRNGNVFELGGELSKHTIVEPGKDDFELMFAGATVLNKLFISNKDKTKYFELVFDENDDLVWDVVQPKVVAIHD
jgi:hypothetical protein